jgi:hypothetical protein
MKKFTYWGAFRVLAGECLVCVGLRIMADSPQKKELKSLLKPYWKRRLTELEGDVDSRWKTQFIDKPS